MQCGVKGVTMDTMASELGISKKTLYKYCSDKNDLVSQTLELSVKTDTAEIDAIIAKNLNAIDENYEISQLVTEKLRELNPAVFHDLQKYHSEVFQIFTNYRNGHIFECVKNNIEKGQNEGLYSSDLDAELVSKLYLTLIDGLLNQQILSEKSTTLGLAHQQMFRYHTRGIASEKGREYLKEKFKSK